MPKDNDDDGNLLTSTLKADISKPKSRLVQYFRSMSNSYIAEKNWRLETSKEIESFVRG
jgi:hypothetical protein